MGGGGSALDVGSYMVYHLEAPLGGGGSALDVGSYMVYHLEAPLEL